MLTQFFSLTLTDKAWVEKLKSSFCFLQIHKEVKNGKDSPKEPQKPHQTVQITYSNGSVTNNIAVNISEELGKTSIWQQLTEGNNNDSKSQP